MCIRDRAGPGRGSPAAADEGRRFLRSATLSDAGRRSPTGGQFRLVGSADPAAGVQRPARRPGAPLARWRDDVGTRSDKELATLYPGCYFPEARSSRGFWRCQEPGGLTPRRLWASPDWWESGGGGGQAAPPATAPSTRRGCGVSDGLDEAAPLMPPFGLQDPLRVFSIRFGRREGSLPIWRVLSVAVQAGPPH